MSAKRRRKIYGVRRETRRPRGWTRWFQEGLFETEAAGGIRLSHGAVGPKIVDSFTESGRNSEFHAKSQREDAKTQRIQIRGSNAISGHRDLPRSPFCRPYSSLRLCVFSLRLCVKLFN